MARLTVEQIEELVRLRTEENKTQAELSEQFGISQPAVWRHLQKRGLTRERSKPVVVSDPEGVDTNAE